MDDLATAWRELSERYRAGEGTGADVTEAHARAYAVARAPATEAAVLAVLHELAARRPGFEPTTVLDVGAGLGTATRAAADVFASVTTATLVERSAAMRTVGQDLGLPPGVDAEWVEGDIRDRPPVDAADLVIASYSLSEVPPADVAATVDRLWAATRHELVVVDTGTPVGFGFVLAARDHLRRLGATLTAPCPDDGACPMTDDTTDWCHFAARLHRTREHRAVKGADLGYEDEKYSYVSASRPTDGPAHASEGRILRHPQRRQGHVRLTVCHDGRIAEQVVARSDRARYRWARDAAWGDALPTNPG